MEQPLLPPKLVPGRRWGTKKLITRKEVTTDLDRDHHADVGGLFVGVVHLEDE